MLPLLLAAALSGCAGQHATNVNNPRTVRVAVCQNLCIDSDIEGNIRRIDEAAARAVAAGAQVACFPEACVIGWVNPDAHSLATPIPGELSDRLGAIARKHGLMLAAGLCELDGGALYDSAVLISSATGRSTPSRA